MAGTGKTGTYPKSIAIEEECALKIGLALGAGAMRGLAHLGVIEVFYEEQLPLHCIAGSSIGSLIGGLYAGGLNIKKMIQITNHMRWEHITDITFPRRGLIKGNKLLTFLRLFTKGQNIEDLPLPFACVAVDIERGEEVQIHTGPLAEAIRASISIPGIYMPFRHQGRLLVDGGLLNRVPCNIVEAMGADYVVGVYIGFGGEEKKARSIYEIILRSYEIMGREILKHHILHADLMISPDVSHIAGLSWPRARECIALGREAARKALPLIQSLVSKS